MPLPSGAMTWDEWVKAGFPRSHQERIERMTMGLPETEDDVLPKVTRREVQDQIVNALRMQKAKGPVMVAFDATLGAGVSESLRDDVLDDVAHALRQFGVKKAVFVTFDAQIQGQHAWDLMPWLLPECPESVLWAIEHGHAPRAQLQRLFDRAGGGTLFGPVIAHAEKVGAGSIVLITDMLMQDLPVRAGRSVSCQVPVVWVALFGERGPTPPFGWKVEYPCRK